MSMNGIDISSYQSSLNLGDIAYDFVLIKATEGTGYVNPYCDTHFQEAKAAGKRRGVYHFFDFNVDAVAQADFFVDNCSGYIRDAIFMLDWEGSGVSDVAAALRFLQRVEQRIGYKPAIYMSESVENTYDWSQVVGGDYGLVEAKYSDYEIDNNYDMSGAGNAPVSIHWPFYFAWQWTSKGRINGYAGDLDCDIAYIDEAAWDKYAGVQAAAPAETTTTTTTQVAAPPVEDTTTTTTTQAPDTTTSTTTVEPQTTTSTTTEPQTATTTTSTSTQAPTPAPVNGASVWAKLLAWLVAVLLRIRS